MAVTGWEFRCAPLPGLVATEGLNDVDVKLTGMLALSAVVGILVGAGIVLGLEKLRDDRRDWRDLAVESTMINRRAYTLPLNNPDMVPASEARHMKDQDVVLGILVNGEARAYPWWLTSNYHVVNDTIGDTPVLITLCEVCGGAAAFRPVVPDLPELTLSFQLCSVGRGTIEIMDHQTMSKWRPFLGTAFEGPLKGRALENYPLLIMPWKEWRQSYPNTWVANGSSQLREREHGTHAKGLGDPDLPPLFARTANLMDHRLGLHDLVFGIRVLETGKSYAIPADRLVPFPNLFVVTLGGKPVLIARQGELAMAAFDLEKTPYRTGFSLVSKSPLLFRSPDGRTWNAFGVSQEPSGAERKLPSAKSYLTEWYEWVSHSPDCEIVSVADVVGTGMETDGSK